MGALPGAHLRSAGLAALTLWTATTPLLPLPLPVCPRRLHEAGGHHRQVGEHVRLVPAARGGYIELGKFRYRQWTPALRAAGIAHRRIYDCRHTFATWAIEDGRLSLIHLATIMGTSVRELEDTYFRWLSRTDEQVRSFLDEYDAAYAVVDA